MRGDPPCLKTPSQGTLKSTPHARGSTLFRYFYQSRIHVYPACAGIHPSISTEYLLQVGLPRMRGDPP